jgi:hypothetical protein
MKRPPREAYTVFAIVLIVFYLVGGAGGIREVRSRIRLWLDPPTTEQVQAAPAPPPGATRPAIPIRQAVGQKLWLADPPSKYAMGGAIAGIILGAMLAMYFTGRPERR